MTQLRHAAHRQAIFAVISTALLMYAMDQTIVATALDTLQRDLHTSINWVGWTITVYAVGQILVLPLTGRMSVRYGRRRIFLWSVALFSLASLGCALADNIYVLIAMRALEAIGGAGFTPSATGIVVDHFGSARDRAVGLFGSIFPIGAMIGPILGGVFVAYWSWRGIFLINVPLGLVIIVLCLWVIPPDAQRTSEPSRTDLVGMVQLGVGTLAMMVGISYLGGTHAHLTSVLFVGPAAVGIVGLTMFWVHVRRVDEPFVPARLISGPGFGVMNVVNFIWGGMSLGLGALIPLYATQRYGIGALSSGTLLTTRGVASIVLSTLAAFALRRTGYRGPMYIGFLLTAVGMLALAAQPVGVSAYLWLSIGAGVTGIGIGWSNPATRNAGLQLAPQQSATIAALRTMGMQAGSIIFVSITTAILAARHDPGTAQAVIFAASGFMMIAAMPLIRRVPEHRGTW